MAKNTLDEKGLGIAGAGISAASMLVLGIFGNMGIYTTAVQQMIKWHLWFNLSLGGIIAGMAEAAVWGFAGGYLFAWIYNKYS